MQAPSSKACTVCKKLKPRKYFQTDKRLKSGLLSACKSCIAAKAKLYRTNHPSAERRIVNRKSMLKTAYGMTLEQYQQMWNAQKGVCAICGEPEAKPTYPNATPQILSVDHNHTTGKIRGLLCRSCNLGLGMFKKDAARIKGVLAYLELYEPEVNADELS